ncbi:hypothetical protein LY76DRAFT_602814 [Colletotrichum caudatum]|nr:hypothetical protein LY76DRAFT_602814 [Colletotrichum caudatum]
MAEPTDGAERAFRAFFALNAARFEAGDEDAIDKMCMAVKQFGIADTSSSIEDESMISKLAFPAKALTGEEVQKALDEATALFLKSVMKNVKATCGRLLDREYSTTPPSFIALYQIILPVIEVLNNLIHHQEAAMDVLGRAASDRYCLRNTAEFAMYMSYFDELYKVTALMEKKGPDAIKFHIQTWRDSFASKGDNKQKQGWFR